jgi:hypothetical protein
MRSFIASALLIALVLIGQQWVTKTSEAQGLSAGDSAAVQLR